MKRILPMAVVIAAGAMLAACNSSEQQATTTEVQHEAPATAGQSAVQDDESQKNVVQVAASSPDHTTLVTAVQKAELVDVLTNAGPFTVFAPTNEAFAQLPAGTVEGLLKPEKRSDLRNILQYHVYVGVLNADSFEDGQSLGQVNGGRVTMGVKDGKVTVNGANIVASIPTSNGVIHVIDKVLLPQ
ncbi:fasciclin domain-containing protein [Pontibacter chinhatensis]|uniref:Uncaracterized surface protein containing fasciclin (FAS1) repeats n=1 Tax=Pontibacter chinhatensis TaxID=1436961 RepID=A0A1I2VTK9_9BACT|nr:fasciclin domain-containing protein [Pontibacter chinhatensis]SFG92490.1 Uncaracterized surface protein containing fasciclin (FAS1) repeats [Pontibacter chinhatensis]